MTSPLGEKRVITKAMQQPEKVVCSRVNLFSEMPSGSCLCGEIKISYSGQPTFTALCHCLDDRKMSNTAVYQVPQAAFTLVQGKPKVYTKTSDFGRDINTHFCPNCGTTLYRTGGSPSVAQMVGIRAGVLDDPSLLDEVPKIECYVERRPKWMHRIEGATQLNGKYEIVEEGAKHSSEYGHVEGRD